MDQQTCKLSFPHACVSFENGGFVQRKILENNADFLNHLRCDNEVQMRKYFFEFPRVAILARFSIKLSTQGPMLSSNSPSRGSLLFKRTTTGLILPLSFS